MKTLKEIQEQINLAIQKSPSADNCQPFSLVWDDKALTIFHDDSRARHILNVNEGASKIALGMLAETFRIVANANEFGTEIIVKNGFGKRNSESAWLQLSLNENSFQEKLFESDKELVPAIQQRHVNRESYEGGFIPLQLKSWIEEQVVFTEKAKTKIINFMDNSDSKNNLLFNRIAENEAYLFSKGDIFSDISKWIRFKRSDAETSKDGLHWSQLGIKIIDIPSIMLLKKFPNLLNFLYPKVVKKIRVSETKKLINSSSSLVSFWCPDQSPMSFIEVGALAMRIWTKLNQIGYGVQPLSAMSLHSVLMQQESENKAKLATQEEQQLFDSNLDVLRQTFDESQSSMPLWLFRTGVTKSLKPSQISLRKDIPVQYITTTKVKELGITQPELEQAASKLKNLDKPKLQ